MLNLARRQRGAGAYEALYFSPDAVAPDKRRLVEMLLDGLAASLARARASASEAASSDASRAARCTALYRGQRILGGLILSLDPAQAPELATELGSIYRYLLRCTDAAVHRQDQARLDEAIALVGVIRGAWASQ